MLPLVIIVPKLRIVMSVMCNDSAEVEVCVMNSAEIEACVSSIMNSAEIKVCVTSTDEVEGTGMCNVSC